jgi:hypothetical protein
MSRTYSRTITAQLWVRGDVESVARWWADPARMKELRTQYESSSVTNFSWDESSESGRLIQIGEWTTSGGRVEIRVITKVGADGSPFQLRPNGSFVREQEVRQARHSRPGREDVTLSFRRMELTEAGPNRTALLNTTWVKRTGYSWWGQARVRISEGQHRMTHLQEWAARCESDIAAETETD